MTDGRLDELLDTLMLELARPWPMLLVIEDLHWADDATLDVLGYLARRIDELNLLLVVTLRDDETGPEHPVQRFLGAASRAHPLRLGLRPLGVGSVQRLSAGSGWDGQLLHEITGGNPFYVSEALAAPADAPVPQSIADAVLARLRQLSARGRDAVERVSVWAGVIEYDLAEQLLDGLDAIAEAEAVGIVLATPEGLRFRHELARRAAEASLSGLRRRQLEQRATALLRARGEVDLPRLVHHAVRAGDAATVAEFAPTAGQRCADAGAHRQALVFFAAALQHEALLAPSVLAEVLDRYAWELYNANRFVEAVVAGERAVDLFRRLGEQRREAEGMVRLSRHLYMAGKPDAASVCAARAVELTSRGRDPVAADALVAQGALLALDDDAAAAVPVLERAQRLATTAGRLDLVSLVLNYRSLAQPELTGSQRADLLRESLRIALADGAWEAAARAYTNLGESLYRYGHYDELADVLTEGLRFTRDRGFWSHAFNLEVHRHLLHVRQGDWAVALAGFADAVRRDADVGMLIGYSVPPYARLLARRGQASAGPMLVEAWARARQQRLLIALGLAGVALLEWAWLNDAPDVAGDVVETFAAHRHRPTAGPLWAEIQRYALRAGVPVDRVDLGESGPWSLGVRGEWEAAAGAWERIGDPYEQALELADSGSAELTVRALAMLDQLEARAAARKVRRRLKALGVRSVPRGPYAKARTNPAGLTSRQLDILALLAEGLTNSEIAGRLVLSVRTVDSHVSSVFSKLQVSSRRDAAERARDWQLPPPAA